MMDYDIPRGRSPSQGQSNHISPQPSPHRYHDASSELALDPAVNHSTFTTGRFVQGVANAPLRYPSPYTDSAAQSHTLPQTPGADSTLYQNSHFNPSAVQNNQPVGFQDNQTFDNPFLLNSTEFLFANENNTMPGDYSNNNFALDPAFDPNQQSNINPATLSKMPSSHASTPPNLLSPENHPSPGRPGSPASTQGQFYTPQHSRHQSLDPARAAYPHGSGPTDWQGMTFQHHRRAPSDQSEISSNAPSPFLPHADVRESIENNHSPMIGAQQDELNAFGIENFTINDQQQQPQVSPGHSPYISPRLIPQQNQGLGMGSDYMLQQGMQNPMAGPGPEIYTTQPDESFGSMSHMHARHASIVSDMGQADQFPAPTINIEPAPASRQASFEPEAHNLGDNLSPPARARGRSKSDPHVSRSNARPVSRSTSPAARPHSPSLGALSDSGSVRSLSPGLGPPSRESSPGPASGRIEKGRRQSTSSIPTRDYILDLADPGRPNASPSHSSTRVQKHPATFQCTLCPKRFTRAYNLRSHLRTHTDERPFVCTVCGKAFARQHDRKRHEGLHSGEKKFVCKGELGSGGHWGCGRKFARADALGRHFRSEAGRTCIKPLLDEEAAERARKSMVEQQQQAQFAAGSLQPVQQPMMIGMDPSGGGGFALPAALLAQYPALSNIDWSAMPPGDETGDLSDVGMGRNSYDASGGEFGYDESDINEGYVANNGMNYAGGVQGAW